MIQASSSITFTFGITGCKCKSFKLTDFGVKNLSKIGHDKYQFTVSVKLDLSREKKDSVIVLVNGLLLKLEGDKEPIAELESEHEFRVVNMTDIIKTTPEGLLVPDAVLTQFYSLCLAAVRGMFSIKLEGTLYENAVMPVMDVTQLIPKRIPNAG